MKIRAIIAIDYDIKGSFKEVANEEDKLQKIIEDFVKENDSITKYEIQDILKSIPVGTGKPQLRQQQAYHLQVYPRRHGETGLQDTLVLT